MYMFLSNLIHIYIFQFLFLIHTYIFIFVNIESSAIIFIVIVYIIEKQLHALIRVEQFTWNTFQYNFID